MSCQRPLLSCCCSSLTGLYDYMNNKISPFALLLYCSPLFCERMTPPSTHHVTNFPKSPMRSPQGKCTAIQAATSPNSQNQSQFTSTPVSTLTLAQSQPQTTFTSYNCHTHDAGVQMGKRPNSSSCGAC